MAPPHQCQFEWHHWQRQVPASMRLPKNFQPVGTSKKVSPCFLATRSSAALVGMLRATPYTIQNLACTCGHTSLLHTKNLPHNIQPKQHVHLKYLSGCIGYSPPNWHTHGLVALNTKCYCMQIQLVVELAKDESFYCVKEVVWQVMHGVVYVDKSVTIPDLQMYEVSFCYRLHFTCNTMHLAQTLRRHGWV